MVVRSVTTFSLVGRSTGEHARTIALCLMHTAPTIADKRISSACCSLIWGGVCVSVSQAITHCHQDHWWYVSPLVYSEMHYLPLWLRVNEISLIDCDLIILILHLIGKFWSTVRCCQFYHLYTKNLYICFPSFVVLKLLLGSWVRYIASKITINYFLL